MHAGFLLEITLLLFIRIKTAQALAASLANTPPAWQSLLVTQPARFRATRATLIVTFLSITTLGPAWTQTSPRPTDIQEAFNELIASSRLWPTHITTHTGFEQAILRDGQPIGSVTIKPGAVLKIASIKPEGIWVEIGGTRKLLALEETDLLERIPARRAEVEAIELIQAQRLRERAEQPINWPKPEPIVRQDSPPPASDLTPVPRLRVVRYAPPIWYYPPPAYRIIYVPYPFCPPSYPVQPQPCPPRYPQHSGIQIAINLR